MVIMLLFSGVIPLCILIFLNTRIYVAIRTRNQRLVTMSSKQRRYGDLKSNSLVWLFNYGNELERISYRSL